MTSPRGGFNYNAEFDFEPATLEVKRDKVAERIATVIIGTWLVFTITLTAGFVLGVILLWQQVFG